jgi:hypothetical protein
MSAEEASIVSPKKYREALDECLAGLHSISGIASKIIASYLHLSPYIRPADRNLSSSGCVASV